MTTTPTETTRDPAATARLAEDQWAQWQPGDGASYRVHVVTISGGPDHADRVLLVNIARRTLAFQFATAAYRHTEGGPWSRKRCDAEGMPAWAWDAAQPLLAEFGVTTKRYGGAR